MAFDRDERLQRAASFGAVAGAYERGRPGYPDDAVLWLAGDPSRNVVDLGAGTGKLTRSLVALGHRVTAVEPLPEMLDELRAAVPDAVALAGSAESIPLDSGSADVVTCAQAFHWFDHGPALAEIASRSPIALKSPTTANLGRRSATNRAARLLMVSLAWSAAMPRRATSSNQSRLRSRLAARPTSPSPTMARCMPLR